ncbi:MAG: type II toxin-antitoxin system RelE/ParE family toxin [Solirubrobacteraceae bacterium]
MTAEPWRLELAGPATRDISRLPEKYATAVVEALEQIARNPRRLGKPLRLELDGHWSARRGPYRIIYVLDDPVRTVRVVAVSHRAHAYRPR